jgi:branched-subunit amino acid permease
VLPLSEHGFGWLLLAILGCIMGYFIKPKGERLPD